MSKPKAPIQQAELLLHLYELRREPVMRQARSYVGGQFQPHSAEDLIDSIRRGDQNTAYILQVFGYWDMLCAFVLHGALTEPLVYDTCQEMYFQWAKIQPYLKTFRREMKLPEWMQSIEKAVDGSAKGRRRIATMQASAKAFAAAPQSPSCLELSRTARRFLHTLNPDFAAHPVAPAFFLSTTPNLKSSSTTSAKPNLKL